MQPDSFISELLTDRSAKARAVGFAKYKIMNARDQLPAGHARDELDAALEALDTGFPL
jgi:hypothetical protein